MSFKIGQRVIVDDQIVVVVGRQGVDTCLERYDVKFVSGLVQFRAPHNIQPLPNGQM